LQQLMLCAHWHVDEAACELGKLPSSQFSSKGLPAAVLHVCQRACQAPLSTPLRLVYAAFCGVVAPLLQLHGGVTGRLPDV
jgi:hypothetical protein